MEIDFQVIKRHFEEKERIGDRERITEWFSDIRYEKDIKKKYRQLWDKLDELKDLGDIDGSVTMGKIYHQIKLDDLEKSPVKNRLVFFINTLAKVAAVLMIPLITYLWITKNQDTPYNGEFAHSEIYAPVGTRTNFYLPDGSTGWLNGGSSIAFPSIFSEETREVRLRGEAYFEVRSDSTKPFVVIGEHADVIAYGTSFNVQAYPEDPDNQITLISGKISLYRTDNGNEIKITDLEPGQMCVYYPGTKLFRIDKVNTNNITAWKEGKLAFRDEAFSEVVRRINRWYNVELIIMDEALRSYNYQATFMDETLDEVLELLQLSAPIEYKDIGREKKETGVFEKRKIELYYKPA